MKAKRTGKKVVKRAVKQTARTAKITTGRPRGRPRKGAAPAKPQLKGPAYRCSICGTEVVITKKGTTRPRVSCCGVPMRRRG